MRIVIGLSAFYDWDPIPKGVVVTEQDIAVGKVMPGIDGGYRMRVVKRPPGGTTRTCTISEGALIEKIIEEKSDIRKAGRTLTRNQAVVALIADQLLPNAAEVDWITGFDVHDDGPSEELLRAKLAPHTEAPHGRRPGRTNVPMDHVETHVAAYLKDWQAMPTVLSDDATEQEVAGHAKASAPVRAANHKTLSDHLHDHFGIARK